MMKYKHLAQNLRKICVRELCQRLLCYPLVKALYIIILKCVVTTKRNLLVKVCDDERFCCFKQSALVQNEKSTLLSF